MHCDISAGNVLIHVRESVEDGKLVQERVGLLTDWELSKRKDAPNIARQPDRTVSNDESLSPLWMTDALAALGNLAVHACLYTRQPQ